MVVHHPPGVRIVKSVQMVPLCRGCLYYVNRVDTGPRCYRQATTEIDVVTGEKFSLNVRHCHVERSFAWLPAWLYRRCGQAGRYFRGRT